MPEPNNILQGGGAQNNGLSPVEKVFLPSDEQERPFKFMGQEKGFNYLKAKLNLETDDNIFQMTNGNRDYDVSFPNDEDALPLIKEKFPKLDDESALRILEGEKHNYKNYKLSNIPPKSVEDRDLS